MYAIDIASDQFKGLSVVKQHRKINEILKEEIKEMHGLQVNWEECMYNFLLEIGLLMTFFSAKDS